MRQFLFATAVAFTPVTTTAQEADPTISRVVNDLILPKFENLAVSAAQMATTAADDCTPASTALRTAYSDAFDAWISASHLRFGPTEVADRAFALAFWPDSRGATPRALSALITEKDRAITSPDAYAQVSIAARGFYAMEFLVFDETLASLGDPDDHCALMRTVTADIATTSAAIFEDWKTDYAARLLAPDASGTYRSDEEVLQELFKALTTGLQFTSQTRLGRPLGTFDRPRPTRAESWRSGRSARHVDLSLAALRDLASLLATDNLALAAEIDAKFAKALDQLSQLDDPVFAGVAQPQSRIRVEALQQSVDDIRAIVRDELGPTLGVAAGFNSLDGD
ncbi:imelysin family protein [Sulfitobacter sp. F26169L]|uniref:imelysin family protein n=1 Tax=Sulfitobacter sp. F26169L TaxID=2996015 RepID=UPI002260C445|nr:imelysin family protein [Sulfitobacter sp. F26169L]MCX7566362.1 imelysin family protein [Sulfitobacter sp. F26169L]